ncbi:hypothetical protein IGI04_030027 [Brassica rapa subsp. trilocularis]|uniref:Uncharacterized protein n=1 Tax=Brassica rapa subsp. trilocularis TaxID=1813537 RepID=A0ABQ7LPI8_BRACM|nr:hypothetical protein IGI04_030027 [Brassica rapa subsp. trilocularis]
MKEKSLFPRRVKSEITGELLEILERWLLYQLIISSSHSDHFEKQDRYFEGRSKQEERSGQGSKLIWLIRVVNAKGDSKSTAQTLLSFLRIPAIELCRESASSRRRRMSSATHQLVYRMHTR